MISPVRRSFAPKGHPETSFLGQGFCEANYIWLQSSPGARAPGYPLGADDLRTGKFNE